MGAHATGHDGERPCNGQQQSAPLKAHAAHSSFDRRASRFFNIRLA
jgi:hypothetical protein